MSTGGTSGAARRSSDPATARQEAARRLVLRSVNERRLTRERVLASLWLSTKRPS